MKTLTMPHKLILALISCSLTLPLNAEGEVAVIPAEGSISEPHSTNQEVLGSKINESFFSGWPEAEVLVKAFMFVAVAGFIGGVIDNASSNTNPQPTYSHS